MFLSNNPSSGDINWSNLSCNSTCCPDASHKVSAKWDILFIKRYHSGKSVTILESNHGSGVLGVPKHMKRFESLIKFDSTKYVAYCFY